MIYEMKLKENPFERIENGTKTVEFRLYDEKRRKIKIGDKIEFLKLPDLQEKIVAQVLDLYIDETFEDLFKKIFTDEKEVKAKTKAMYQYYSKEEEKKYGVVGIKIRVLSKGFRYTYNKLVRDNIPEEINNDPDRKCQYKILDDAEYLYQLNKKLLEEANEFVEENSIEELGDLLEVINAIMNLRGYNLEEVKKVMLVKEGRKGKFNKRIFLEYVEEKKRNLVEERELKKEFRKS